MKDNDFFIHVSYNVIILALIVASAIRYWHWNPLGFACAIGLVAACLVCKFL